DQIPNPNWSLDIGHWSLADRWILSRHNRLIANVTRLFERYQFGEAGRQIHDFFWGEYCDWYIEMAKIRLYGDDPQAADTARQVLVHVLDRTLRLLHPFMPFVTEEIWQHLRGGRGEGREESIMIAPWPEVDPSLIDAEAEAEMALIMELVRAIRNARADYEVEPGRRIAAIIAANGRRDLLAAQADVIATLARVDPARLCIEEKLAEKPTQALTLVVGDVEAYLPLAGLVDLDRERERLAGEIADLDRQIARLEGLLAQHDFVAKAPAHVVERERAKLTEYQGKRARLEERLRSLEV
ncbi:MAG TPA: valine--tRNA ligase, partial [Anaerolineae bacterium]|nr:valine--tRNA ligase [Anaerolineae bacterium]